MAAAAAPVGQTARARSGLPLVLRPAVVADHWKPWGRVEVVFWVVLTGGL